MITHPDSHKEVFAISSFIKHEGSLYPYLHGTLYFSSIEKLKTLCTWDITQDNIYIETVEDNFDDYDYVPENY